MASFATVAMLYKPPPQSRTQGVPPGFRIDLSIPWLDGLHLNTSASISSTDAKIIYALAASSVVTGVFFLLHAKIWAFFPAWLQPFAKEEGPIPKKRKAWTQWTLLLGFVCISGMILSIISLCLEPRQLPSIWEIAPWLSATLITAFDRPTKTPRLLLLLYFLILSAGLAMYCIHFLDNDLRIIDPYRLARMALSSMAVLIIVNMPLRNPAWDTEDIGNPQLPPTHHVRSPEDNLTLFQFWTVNWVYPLARICRYKEITVEEIWQLPWEFQHTRLYLAFRDLKGNLIPRLIQSNGLDLVIATILAIGEKVAEVTNIRLTSCLYVALDGSNLKEANFWCLAMLCIDAIRQLAKTASQWYSRKAYERSRGETFIALFDKLLTRAVPGSDLTENGPLIVHSEDGEAKAGGRLRLFFAQLFCLGRRHKYSTLDHQQASNAKVVNLVRGDTYEISQRFWDFPKLVSLPIKIAFATYYLIDIMGWPCCVGFGLMAILLTTNSILVHKIIKVEGLRTAHSDKRAQAVSHFVEASRPLKLNGWTFAWRDRIMTFRAMEMSTRLQIARITAAISTMNVSGGAIYPLVSIALYTIVLGQRLPNKVIWPSLQLFAQLEASVKEAFDLASAYWKATIPISRVNKFMEEPNRDEASESTRRNDVEFQNASFSWSSADAKVLRNISLTFPQGLTVIRGEVGSGKSSLLLAALNEMDLQSGAAWRPDEPIGYAQQLPWLQNKTIRENITFHHQVDHARYQQVLYSCALTQDLAALPEGDLTRLEEGGVGLSGGQKARVALARAVYSPCRVLLLDDPLAPLDHDTATKIVSRLLQGPLAHGRTIVMVTHRDDLVLRIADQVIDMKDGKAHVLSEEQIRLELEHPYHDQISYTAGENMPETSSEMSAQEPATTRDSPEETSNTGKIQASIYLEYMRAGGWYLWVLLISFYGLSRYCDISRARLLEAWGSDSATKTSNTLNLGYWGLPNPEIHPKIWLYALGGLSAVQIASHGIAQLLLARIGVDAAQGLFASAIDKISKATFRYHDTTPTGQLKNRLISDMGMVDGGILAPLEAFVYNLINLIMSMVAITTHQPALLSILAAVSLLFVRYFQRYIPASRCLRRMEMRYLTPIIANIGVMQDGLVTIRALRAEKYFQDRHLEAVDDFQRQDHFFWSMAFWLDFRLSMSSACARSALVVFMIWCGLAASAIGFVLTQMTSAMGAVQLLCEKVAQLQLDAVSLERISMLKNIPEEPSGGEDPPPNWPSTCDNVKFESATFRYADELPDVLDQVTFEIPGGSTCAVLGRTGSGKSTIANALLVTEQVNAGRILVGSIDVAQVNRMALRRRVTFIQQDPTLFPGTLHDNLDPQGEFGHEECQDVVNRVLGPLWDLESTIDAGGKNLSQGQRQLVAIARAVLRKSGLVLLDEATASIDRATASRAQRILREELSSSTVVTIAHRLDAVEDANWCLRLEQGHVMECGPTNNLAKRRSGSGSFPTDDE